MRCFANAIVVAALVLAGATAAQAGIVVTVDKSAQRLTVAVDGATPYQWPVSTARWGYRTPNGSYRPERLERQWYSRKYDWSPMPHAIFFHHGYAIHGSYEVSRLGRPASARLHPPASAERGGSVRPGQAPHRRYPHRRHRRRRGADGDQAHDAARCRGRGRQRGDRCARHAARNPRRAASRRFSRSRRATPDRAARAACRYRDGW